MSSYENPNTNYEHELPLYDDERLYQLWVSFVMRYGSREEHRAANSHFDVTSYVMDQTTEGMGEYLRFFDITRIELVEGSGDTVLEISYQTYASSLRVYIECGQGRQYVSWQLLDHALDEASFLSPTDADIEGELYIPAVDDDLKTRTEAQLIETLKDHESSTSKLRPTWRVRVSCDIDALHLLGAEHEKASL